MCREVVVAVGAVVAVSAVEEQDGAVGRDNREVIEGGQDVGATSTVIVQEGDLVVGVGAEIGVGENRLQFLGVAGGDGDVHPGLMDIGANADEQGVCGGECHG